MAEPRKPLTDTLHLKIPAHKRTPLIARDRKVASDTIDFNRLVEDEEDYERTDTLHLKLPKETTLIRTGKLRRRAQEAQAQERSNTTPPIEKPEVMDSTVHLKLNDTGGARSRSTLRKSVGDVPEQLTEGLFLEFFEAVYDAVLITELNGRVIKANSRAAEFFQYREPEFRSLSILELLQGATQDVLSTTAESLRREQFVFIEGYCRRRNGDLFPADITVNLLHTHEDIKLCFFIRNITLRRETEEKLAKARQQLIETAHGAGMAEIATAVLHDIGNVLNSVNVSCDVILQALSKPTTEMLMRTNSLVIQNEGKLADFLTNDRQGQKVPELLNRIAEELFDERADILTEATSLRNNVSRIKDVISTQQTYAKAEYYVEEFHLNDVVDDAINIQLTNAQYLQVDRDYGATPTVSTQRTKLVMILMNILANARDAMAGNPISERFLDVKTGLQDDGMVFVSIGDNGEGISEENLTKIFTHGFTTKADGHGFGLHTCANLMTEMNGRLIAESEGPGQGSTFTLVFPPRPVRSKS
jgi:PAS domain S-box-containing protein